MDGSLLVQLDRVRVGARPWTEGAALQILDALDAEGLRQLLHIPSDEELGAAGFSRDVRKKVAASVQANLGGLKRVADLRSRDKRGRVLAFNKLKHVLLALPTTMRGKNEVLVPKLMTIDSQGIRLQNAWIEASEKNVRLMVSRAIIAQAVLNSVLGTILLGPIRRALRCSPVGGRRAGPSRLV